MKPARFHEDKTDEHVTEGQPPHVSPEEENAEERARPEVNAEDARGESSPSGAENA